MRDKTSMDGNAWTDRDWTTTDRRSFLRAVGVAGATTVGLAGATSGTVAAAPDGGPDSDDWKLVYQEDFDGTLDSSAWNSGFGWGSETSSWEATADPGNVSVDDSKMLLEATNPDDGPPYHTGAVSTEGEVTIAPGSYVECEARLMDLPGSIPAFWSMPTSNDWPPELDIMEMGVSAPSSTDEVQHHIHWSDQGDHRDLFVGDASGDFQESYHTFGCEWQEDSVTYYVDGSETGSTEDPEVMDSLNDAAPNYLLFTQTLGNRWTGDPPSGDWDEYDTKVEVDQVRVWERS